MLMSGSGVQVEVSISLAVPRAKALAGAPTWESSCPARQSEPVWKCRLVTDRALQLQRKCNDERTERPVV